MAAEPPPDGLIEWAFGVLASILVAAFSWTGMTFRAVFTRIDGVEASFEEKARNVAKLATDDIREVRQEISHINTKLDLIRQEGHNSELRLMAAIHGRPSAQ